MFNLQRGRQLWEIWQRNPENTDVLITHGPPRGIGDRCYDGRQEECDDLLARVNEIAPKLHLSGHIHEHRESCRIGPTEFANVTTNEATKPVTVIDL